MDLFNALQIVLDLARQNLCDEEEMPAEYARQTNAIETVENYCNSLE